MSPRKTRKYFTAQEKMALLPRHLAEEVAVSDLCEEHQVPPSMFFRWQQEP